MAFSSEAPVVGSLNRLVWRPWVIFAILLGFTLLLGCATKPVRLSYLGYTYWNRCSAPLEVATIEFSNGLTPTLIIEKPGWASHDAMGAPIPESMDVVWKIRGGPERRQTVPIKGKVTDLGRLKGFVVYFKDDQIEIYESLNESDVRSGTNKIN